MPDAQLNNIRLHYEVHGEGEPLVLIPGFGTGLWIWFKQTPVFTRHFKVILFDPRGVASSEHRDEAISIRTIADDVAELMRFLGIERAHILGASFGGFVAQEFALAYPEMTASLILCCTSFGGPNHVPPSLETLQALASTKGLNTAERVRENLLLAFSQEFVQENRDDIEKVIALRAANYVPEYVYLNQLQAAYAFNTEGQVKEITAPTLVLSGDHDTIVPVQNSINLAKRIPGAVLRTVHGGSHTFFIEKPAEFNSEVIEFISGVRPVTKFEPSCHMQE